MQSTLRRDPLTGTLVIYAPARTRRPMDAASAGSARCPFCPRNEHRTPPELDAIRPTASEPNSEGWSARAVPNLHPALQP